MLFVSTAPPVRLRSPLVIMEHSGGNRQNDVERGQEGKSRILSLSLFVLIAV